ncbi:MAG: aldehyde dehydrogenase family protein, partial [Gammaproteobacteria bacterium]|nr:aldehyde dehydrogenase family protein [Gammaproteobacteria bacterium]
MRRIGNFIDGRLVDATGEGVGDVYDPATGAVQAQVVHASPADLERAVASAAAAQVAWARVNPQRRARVMAEFARLLEANMDALARLLSSEHGKVLSDARGDLQRGLEVVEFACGIPHLLKGEYTRGAGPGIDVHSAREPLGVVAGITPFNFPAMIPMWMFAPAIASGNAFILKPSERNPSVPLRLAELMIEAGLPAGVLNVVQGGGVEAGESIVQHDAVRAISFTGSTAVGRRIAGIAGPLLKKVSLELGGKNPTLVFADSDWQANLD